MSVTPGTRLLINTAGRPIVQHLRVEVRRGPSKGLTYNSTTDEPIRIGTASGCQLKLHDSSVSALHAEISRNEHGVLLRDLGSTNGMTIDGLRVQGVYIENKIDVRMGETDVRITALKDFAEVDIVSDDRFGELLGSSMPMRATFSKLQRIANKDITVLITGETGCGKELAAAALRDHSLRKDKPFVVVDCGALPHNLIESELFGHERGAFTGAEKARAGAFERASGGTIFLDEVGELPLALQPSLLGVLERRVVRRVGGSTDIPLNVRVIAATNRDPAQEVGRGVFRADLFYRLAIIEIHLPPLREHPEDIPLLVEHFLSQVSGERPSIGPEMMQRLIRHPWPGNVRELRNVIERATALAEAPQLRTPNIERATPHASIQENTPTDIHTPFKEQKNLLVKTFEERYIHALLKSTDGNVAKAARIAGIDRMYVYKLMSRYAVQN